MGVVTDVQEHTQEYISEEVQRFGQVAAGFSDADFDQFLLKLRDTYEQTSEGEIAGQFRNDEVGVINDDIGSHITIENVEILTGRLADIDDPTKWESVEDGRRGLDEMIVKIRRGEPWR